MPPKKAKAKANPKPFAGIAIAFAKPSFPPGVCRGKKLGDIEPVLKKLGGKLYRGGFKDAQCTYYVCTADQYKQLTDTIPKAIANPDIRIVDYEWLEDSLHHEKPLEDLKYVLHDRGYSASNSSVIAPVATSTSTVVSNQAKPTTGRKRGRAAASKDNDDNDDDDDRKDASAIKKAKSELTIEEEKNKDGQIAKSSSLVIPLDDGAPPNYKVVISDDGMIYDATLNQTNAGHNNNKFYRIQILQDTSKNFHCWTRWGRVGERGQSKIVIGPSLDEAFKDFNKKFKDKNGNRWEDRFEATKAGKYTFVEKNYEESDGEDDDKQKNDQANNKDTDDSNVKEEEVESKLPEPVQRLMGLIFNQEYFQQTFAALNYDAQKMPLGKLSKRTLLRGYDVLKDLANIVASSTPTSDIAEKSNQYFSLIPHAFGRGRPPVLSSMDTIKREIELLDTLTDMSLANDIIKDARKNKENERIHVFDRQYMGLGMQEMTPLDPKTNEFKELKTYLEKSAGQTHSINPALTDIFRIERQGEFDRFTTSKYGKYAQSDRRLLWHGSRCTNFGGILSQGLRIAPPEAPVSGYMFGKGVYLADMSTKSANYCRVNTSGNTGLLLLCEVELGKPPLKLTGADYNAGERAAQSGSISTWGVGITVPQGWKDAGCVNKNLKGVLMPDTKNKPPGPSNEQGAYLMYNEYIAYDVAQIKLRYLLRFKV